MRRTALFYTATIAVALLWNPAVEACSRILWSDNGQAVLSARNMEFYTDDLPSLVVFPRGLRRHGGDIGGAMSWTSKYASISVAGMNGAGIDDGLNEKGLAAHLLWLQEARYEPLDERPGISYVVWLQYLLDNHATVQEALADLPRYQVVPVPVEAAGIKKELPLHLAIEDASGDSAVIEFVDGKMSVYHDRQYTVMTNEPAFPKQLENLKRYKPFGGTLSLPGDIDPMSRFVRASTYLKTLQRPENYREAVAMLLSVIRDVQVPFGARDYSGTESEDVWDPKWMSLADLTHHVYYFNVAKSANLVWAGLESFDLNEGASVMVADPRNPALIGDIAGAFRPVEEFGKLFDPKR
ncbi:MAG: linear amide C-N hydrolase [Hyphomicrobiales bacterium]